MFYDFKHFVQSYKEGDEIGVNPEASPTDGWEGQWYGGSESATFNMLEKIAMSNYPKTPVLECRITKALETKTVKADVSTWNYIFVICIVF